MPVVEHAEIVHASQKSVFLLSQSYHLRSCWDPFVKFYTFSSENILVEPGLRVWVHGRNGFSLEAEYTAVQYPNVVVIKMTQGPWFFRSFTGTWQFTAVDESTTNVLFRYSFQTKWKWLSPLLDRIIARMFRKDVQARVRGFRKAVEETDILDRVCHDWEEVRQGVDCSAFPLSQT